MAKRAARAVLKASFVEVQQIFDGGLNVDKRNVFQLQTMTDALHELDGFVLK